MLKFPTVSRTVILLFIPLAILLTLTLLVRSSLFGENPDLLALGVTLDFVLTVPLIYFFIIRKTSIPNTTVVPVFVLGVLLGGTVLPAENQALLSILKQWGIPLVELGVFFLVLFKIRKARKAFKEQGQIDFYTALKEACSEILPAKVSTAFAMEVATFYYGFFAWKKQPLKANAFSYHKNSGTPAVLAVVIFMIGIETVALHLLLERWSVLAAWILTVLSLYTGLQIWGALRSLYKRPIEWTDTQLVLRYGIWGEVTINKIDIVEVKSTSKVPEESGFIKLSPLGELEEHNIILTVNTPHILIGLYGIKRSFQAVGFYVDDVPRFMEMWTQKS